MLNFNQGARLSLREAKRWRNPDKILTPEPETFAKVYENRLDRQILAMAALSARKTAEKERQNPKIAVHRASLDQPICIKRSYERILDANALLESVTKAAKSTEILPESAEYCEVVEISLHPCVLRACREQLYASPDEHPYCFAPQSTGRYQNATLLLADPLFQKLEAVLNSRHIPDETTAGVAAKSGLLRKLTQPRRSPVEVQQEHQEFLRWWMAEGSWASILSEPDRYDYRRLRTGISGQPANKPTHLERQASATLRASKYSRPGSLPASSKKLSETLPQINLRIEPSRHPCFEALTEKTKKQIREAQADYQFPPSLPANIPVAKPRQQVASDNTFATPRESTSLKSIASKSKQLLESRAMQILANTVEMLEARQEKIRQTYQITGVESFTGRPTTETLPKLKLPVATTVHGSNTVPTENTQTHPPTHPDFAKYLQNQRRLDTIEQKIQDAQDSPEPAETLIEQSKPVTLTSTASSRFNPPILPALSILPTPLPHKARALKLAENAASLLQIPHLNLQTILAQPRPANYQTISPFFIAPLLIPHPEISFADSFARLALAWLDTMSPSTATPRAILNSPLDAPIATNQTQPAVSFSKDFAKLSCKLLPKTSHETVLCKSAKTTLHPPAHPAQVPQAAPPLAQVTLALPQAPPTLAPPNISPENLHAYPPSALISQLLNSPPSQQLLFACSLPHNILHVALKHYLHTLQHSEHADISALDIGSTNTPIHPNLEVLSRLSYQPYAASSPGFPAQVASLQQALAWQPSKLFISTCRKLL